jgi:N-acetylmuramoyl-L-alanine amidase
MRKVKILKEIILIPSDQIHNMSNDGRSEKSAMVKFCADVNAKLKSSRGIEAIVYKDKLPNNLNDEVSFVNKHPNGVMLSIHSNAAGTKNTGHGVEGFYYSSDQFMKHVMTQLVNRVSHAEYLPVRGVYSYDELTMIGGIAPHAGLIELYFHDSDSDIAKYKQHYKDTVNEFAYTLFLLATDRL